MPGRSVRTSGSMICIHGISLVFLERMAMVHPRFVVFASIAPHCASSRSPCCSGSTFSTSPSLCELCVVSSEPAAARLDFGSSTDPNQVDPSIEVVQVQRTHRASWLRPLAALRWPAASGLTRSCYRSFLACAHIYLGAPRLSRCECRRAWGQAGRRRARTQMRSHGTTVDD